MGRNSSIEWTHHTFNPWWGCVRVSHACTHCYADTMARRWGMKLWGPKADRRFFGDQHWREPLKWNREANADGVRRRVFCASMADILEDRADLVEHRRRTWELIAQTPSLDWLLLTKRPENIASLIPWQGAWPANVWMGTTAEDQESAKERLPHLLKAKAKVRFVSCEPLLGPVSLRPWLGKLHWVIAGGESGPKARPSDPEWFRSLREQCNARDVAFHFKQWGNWAPAPDSDPPTKGKRAIMVRLDKKQAGRLLDGVAWDELPF